MDSLLANYASSDEEEEQQDNQRPPQPSNSFESLQHHKPSSSSLFSSLPKPQSSSPFASLPPPKSNPKPKREGQAEEKELPRDLTAGSKPSSRLFSALPPPKSRSDLDPISSSSGSGSTTKKRVVQFRPPLIQPSALKPDDDDDSDEEFEKKKPQTINPNASFKSFLSSMPAPTNSTTLGVMSGSGGSGRRAIVETAAPALNSDVYKAEKPVDISYGASSAQHSLNDAPVVGPSGPVEDQYGGGSVAGDDASNWGQTNQSYVGYEGYESYSNYGAYSNCEGYANDGSYDHSNNWANASSAWVAPEASGTTAVDNVPIVPGKRGRNRVPTEIVEVNQDELMKNRPREDKVKLTGIAFGPAYQAAAPSGIKPNKLHKRKHQIGSLYFDMRQKEMELAERRAKGMLTKAETQAKYGW